MAKKKPKTKAELIEAVADAHKWTYPLMKPTEYSRALQYFGLPNTRFARLIGVQWRQAQRYRDGSCRIPETTAKLIRTAIRHELTAEDIG